MPQTTLPCTTSLWNSLEVVKLVSSWLTPVAVVVVGLWVNRIAKRLEANQWANQKIIEKRLAIYDELAPSFNDLLCYFTYIGNWKEQSPPDVVALKRRLDRRVHVVAPLFSPHFINAYYNFINLCFETFTSFGADAKLRTSPEPRRQVFTSDWQESWDHIFSTEISEPGKVRDAYRSFMAVFSRELGVGLGTDIPAGQGPFNRPPRSATTDSFVT